MKKNRYILGLNLSHNATACLLKDGKVIGCVSEERFNRIKNYTGFPKLATEYLLKNAEIKSRDLDFVVNAGTSLTKAWNPELEKKHPIKKWLFLVYYFMSLSPIIDYLLRELHYFLTKKSSQIEIYYLIKQNLGIPNSKIILAPHHTCHAYAGYFGLLNERLRQNKHLILTHDAEGDMLCGMINIGHGNTVKTVAEIPAGNSLAAIYGDVTALMGMKINEHEYKIMGLAPYASDYEVNKVYKYLEPLVDIRGIIIKTKFGMRGMYMYLSRSLASKRFDGIAGSVQKLMEEKINSWVKNSIQKFEISNLVLGGGLFMNIKVNKLIGELKGVNNLFICPSSGDESNAIGSAYYGYLELCRKLNIQGNIKPLDDLYLGPSYSDNEIRAAIKNFREAKNFKIEKHKNIEKVIAQLLATKQIVARFKGKMEWGARALGNRSILANPVDTEIIRIINEQIKSRDFWMPFACTILKERAEDYIVNTKSLSAPFMVLAFDTTDLGKKELKAAIHPYDYTARPQILNKETNLDYYTLIKEFEKITGIGGILNTSFNLHGEPVVCSPDDAMKTFFNSGLQYMALGNYLISKTK